MYGNLAGESIEMIFDLFAEKIRPWASVDGRRKCLTAAGDCLLSDYWQWTLLCVWRRPFSALVFGVFEPRGFLFSTPSSYPFHYMASYKPACDWVSSL